MAGLSTLEQQTISQGCAAAKYICLTLYPLLLELNVIFDASGGVKSTITQPNLDATPSLSGITDGQINDGFYALTATLRSDIAAAYAQLATIAARAS